MNVEDEVRAAETEMDRVLKIIRNSKPGKQTAGHEAQYGQAYQRLVRAGARPQIRLKHRG
jgi:hypothetical protein